MKKIIFYLLILSLFACEKDDPKPEPTLAAGYYPVLPQPKPKKRIVIRDVNIQLGQVIIDNDSTTISIDNWTIENSNQESQIIYGVSSEGELDSIKTNISLSARVIYLKDPNGTTIDYWVTSQH
jgi:hypothetical protein